MPLLSAGYAPDLEKYLKSTKGQPLEASIESLISLLRRRQIKGSEPCAVATAHILLQVVAKSKWQDVDTLVANVSKTGRKLVDAQPNELAVANIVRRVLGLIRDEAAEDRNEPMSESQSEAPGTPISSHQGGINPSHQWQPAMFARQDSAGPDSGAPSPRPGLMPSSSFVNNMPKSLFHLLSASPPLDGDAAMQGSPFGNSGVSTPTGRGGQSGQTHALRSEVIDGIEEIKDEISQVDDQIAALAEFQIHPGDHVLIHRPSSTVERFILRAAVKRKFSVFIAADAPRKPDEEGEYAAFRKKLSTAGVTAINIMSNGLAAYMSRVNKVVLGAKAIVANGGVVADSGAGAIARAAKEHGSAVVVLSGVYQLSPENPFDDSSVVEWGDPSRDVNFANGLMVNDVEVRTAVTELIPPELVDTYITNLGTHSRDHLSSLIADHYKQEDVDFHLCAEADR